MKKIWIFDSNLLISVVDCLFKIFTLLTLRIESEKCCKRKTSLSWSFFSKLHSLIFRRVIQSHKTSQIFCSHPPLESPGHHATEQLQFVHLGTPRNRGTAPFDEGLVLARSTTACSTASAAGDATLTGAVGHLLLILPRAHAIRAAWVFNVVFVCLLCPSKKWSENVFGDMLKKKKQKSSGFMKLVEFIGETWRFEKDLQTIGSL